MTTARDIMSSNPRIVKIEDSVRDVAKILDSENIGGVIVCNTEDRLQGMVTDRDLAIEVIAAGRDPESTTAGDLVGGREVVTIGADDSIDEALETMKRHAVRRLPVIDGDQIVGLVSQADLARNIGDDRVGELIEAISDASDNTGRG